MESVKLRNFKGLYTNIDESDGDPEFFRECKDIKIRPGQISSESLVAKPIDGLVNPDEEVLYFGTVYLDNDKNGNKYTAGKLVSDYKRDLKSYYLLIVYKEQTRVRLYNTDREKVYETPSYRLGYPKFEDIKIVNTDGRVKILTNGKIYLLSKISRLRYPALISVYPDKFLFDELISPSDRGLVNTGSIKLVTEGALNYDPIIILDGHKVDGVGKNIESYKYTFYLKDGNSPIDLSPIPHYEFEFGYTYLPAFVYKSGEWLFPFSHDVSFNNKPGLVCPKNFFELHFDFYSRYENKDLWTIKNNPDVSQREDRQYDPGSGTYLQHTVGTYYIVARELFTKSDWYYKKGQLVSTVGFEKTTGNKVEIICTIIADYQDEVVDSYSSIRIPNETTKYGILIENIDVSNLSQRITAIAFYMRINEKSDFEQFKYIDLCSGKQVHYMIGDKYKIVVSSLTPNGIFLNQTIGVMYDTNRYKLITSVQDYKVISGIPFIISNGNLVSGAIGSGNAMNVFYEQNIVPDVSDLNLTQLVDVNGTLGAADESSISLISVSNSEGVLLFSNKGTMSYGVSDANHIVELPEGTVFYTKQGIYVMDGYEQKFISQQINDIVESSYPNGWLEYDSINEELYYSNGSRLFKYSSMYQYWTEVSFGGIYRIRTDDDGNFSFADGNQLYNLIPRKGTSYIRTMNMDLGYPDIAKTLQSVVIDFEGTLWIDDEKLSAPTRSMIVKSLRLKKILNNGKVHKEVRGNTIRFFLDMKFTGTIYGITLNYEVQGAVKQSKIYSNI